LSTVFVVPRVGAIWVDFWLYLSVALALGIYVFLARRRGVRDGEVFWFVTVWIVTGCILGKLYNVRYYQGRPWAIDDVIGAWRVGVGAYSILGMCFAGILTVGVFALAGYRVDKLKVLSDAAVLGLCSGQILDRGACFLNGCCFGKPTDLPWGVIYSVWTNAGQRYPKTPIHPVQLYEVGLNLLLLGVLM